VNLRFSYRVADGWGQAFSRDVSVNGAFLKTDRILPLGTRIEVQFRLPGVWEEIRCHGVVRNTLVSDGHAAQLGGFGIEFEGMRETDVERLELFIERHVRRSVLSR
jgi:hypothetical protein